MVRPEFEQDHPGPWSSAVLHDDKGEPIVDGVWLRQFFLDNNGRPVRDSDGRFMHILQEDGKPVIGDDGFPVYAPVEILPHHRDHKGRRIHEVYGDEL